MPFSRKVGLDPGDIVLDGDRAALHKKGAEHPQFSAHDYCAQTAGWIKTPLGTEVGLDPSVIVFYGDPAPPPQKGGISLPNFRPMSTVVKRLH